MLYVGIDIHKATIQVTTMDVAGSIVLEKNIRADRRSVLVWTLFLGPFLAYFCAHIDRSFYAPASKFADKFVWRQILQG